MANTTNEKLLSRDDFPTGVFARDGHRSNFRRH
jgi:hypothetical protein